MRRGLIGEYESVSAAENKHNDNVIVTVLVCLLIALFAIRAPFSASFWTDETISKWIVSESIADVIHRAVLFQGQSPFYYVLLWCVGRLFGGSEETLRSLSVLCSVATAMLVYRMTSKLTKDRAAAFLSVGALLCCDVFQDAILSARPYALAILFSTASVVLLHGLRAHFSQTRALLFTLTVVGAWYAHFLFAAIVIPHLAVIIRSPRLGRRLLPWSMVGALLCIPGVFQAVSLSRRGGSLSFASMPDHFALLNGAIPLAVTVSVLVGLSLGLIWGGRFARSDGARHALLFLLPYVVLPVGLFAVWTFVSGQSMWVPRYWSWQLPILAVGVGVFLNDISGARGRAVARITTALFLVLRIAMQHRVVEDWRGVAEALAPGEGAIALYSGLIEAESGEGRDKPEFDSYLRVPLLVYGVQRPIQIIGLSQREEVIAEILKGSSALVVVKRAGFEGTSPQHFTAAARKNGIDMASVGNFGGVALYEKR